MRYLHSGSAINEHITANANQMCGVGTVIYQFEALSAAKKCLSKWGLKYFFGEEDHLNIKIVAALCNAYVEFNLTAGMYIH